MPKNEEFRGLSFWRHSWSAIKCAFAEFRIWRDMLIGTVIALFTLGIQVRQQLIPASDWRQHKTAWILSFVIPYIVILGGHAIWRLVRAPWLFYRETEREHLEELSKLTDKHNKELAAEREEKQPSPQKLVIHSARYGTGEIDDVSVLDEIQNIPRDGLVIPVDNRLVRGRDDPAPNQPKRLVVEYSYGESPRRIVEKPESQPGRPSRLILPEDSETLRTSEKANRDWASNWKELAGEFREMSRQQVNANWTRTSVGESWYFQGSNEAARRVESLSKNAGDLLLASPRVSEQLPSEFKSYPSCDRWLYYLKIVTRAFHLDGYGSEPLGDGTIFTSQIGSIQNVAEVSANACMECAGKEY